MPDIPATPTASPRNPLVSHLLATEAMKKINQTMAAASPDDPCPCGSGKKFRLCHGRKSSISSK
jgi:uncharacterized protein YecA (UPF0149 family)